MSLNEIKNINIDFEKLTPLKQPETIIKEKRKALGITQEKAAEILGLSLRQFQRYENGQKELAEAPFQLGVNMCELFKIDLYDAVAPLDQMLSDGMLPGELEP